MSACDDGKRVLRRAAARLLRAGEGDVGEYRVYYRESLLYSKSILAHYCTFPARDTKVQLSPSLPPLSLSPLNGVNK